MRFRSSMYDSHVRSFFGRRLQRVSKPMNRSTMTARLSTATLQGQGGITRSLCKGKTHDGGDGVIRGEHDPALRRAIAAPPQHVPKACLHFGHFVEEFVQRVTQLQVALGLSQFWVLCRPQAKQLLTWDDMSVVGMRHWVFRGGTTNGNTRYFHRTTTVSHTDVPELYVTILRSKFPNWSL